MLLNKKKTVSYLLVIYFN